MGGGGFIDPEGEGLVWNGFDGCWRGQDWIDRIGRWLWRFQKEGRFLRRWRQVGLGGLGCKAGRV